MSVHRRDTVSRTGGFVDPKEILRCDHPGERSNLGNLTAAR